MREDGERAPQPPFHAKDYSALLELLGPEEFERRVCSLGVARERLRERRESYGVNEARRE